MEITPGWKQIIRIWWALTWRNICAIFLATCLIFFLTYIATVALGLLGVSESIVYILMLTVGALVGLGISIFPIRMLVGKNLGEFRLTIIKSD